MDRTVIIIIAVASLIVCAAVFVVVFKMIAKVFKTVSDKGAALGSNIQEKVKRMGDEMALMGQEAVCPSCGAPNTSTDPFCEYCGSSLVKGFGSSVNIVFKQGGQK